MNPVQQVKCWSFNLFCMDVLVSSDSSLFLDFRSIIECANVHLTKQCQSFILLKYMQRKSAVLANFLTLLANLQICQRGIFVGVEVAFLFWPLSATDPIRWRSTSLSRHYMTNYHRHFSWGNQNQELNESLTPDRVVMIPFCGAPNLLYPRSKGVQGEQSALVTRFGLFLLPSYALFTGQHGNCSSSPPGHLQYLQKRKVDISSTEWIDNIV